VNSEDIEKYSAKLSKLSLEIEDSAAAVEPDNALGRLSRMEAMQDQQMVLELRRRKKRQLLDVGNAIKRIEQECFGSCMFCGQSISPDRLDAFPEVQICVNCA
jgi:DnaK suppressor protein